MSGLERLKAALSAAAGLPVEVILTRNRRRWVSVRREPRAIRVRAHEALSAAPAEVLAALARFVTEGCRKSGRRVRDHLSRHLPAATAAIRPVPLRPRGQHHDLTTLLAQAAHHLPGTMDLPPVTWGPRRKPGLSQVRLGSYDPKRRLIRVNPVLDQASVPDYVIRHVLYHELIHHLLAASPLPGEAHHGARFRTLESRCPDRRATRDWQRRELSGLLKRAHQTR
ncbi:MAG: hypothetical protein OEY97_01345 [Nitrospirota bacterium]|nr:hypothetical protein [Nitrospirota bacterium]